MEEGQVTVFGVLRDVSSRGLAQEPPREGVLTVQTPRMLPLRSSGWNTRIDICIISIINKPPQSHLPGFHLLLHWKSNWVCHLNKRENSLKLSSTTNMLWIRIVHLFEVMIKPYHWNRCDLSHIERKTTRWWQSSPSMKEKHNDLLIVFLGGTLPLLYLRIAWTTDMFTDLSQCREEQQGEL